MKVFRMWVHAEMNVLLEEKNVLIAVASILLEKKLLLVKVLAVH
jgi:hypothetical protein